MAVNTVVSSTSRKNTLSRWVRRKLFQSPSATKKVLMIMGAQRSGTTLFSRIFDDLYYADVFGEFSDLSSQDKYRLRLDPPEDVNRQLAKSSANLVVMKPLVESQRANYWQENIPGSVVVWLYRDYSDVASSNVVKFGELEGGINHARAFVDHEFAEHSSSTWKSENATAETIRLIESHYHEHMNPYDAAALFWYARNTLFADQALIQKPNVILVRYESFVQHPFLVMAYILDKLAINEFKSNTLSDIGPSSIGKGKSLGLDSKIEELCSGLLEHLNEQFYGSPLGQMLKPLEQQNNSKNPD